MDAKKPQSNNSLPDNIEACRLLIASLQSQLNAQSNELQYQSDKLQQQATELALKERLIEQQAHSALELKSSHDRLDAKVNELNLTIEKLLQQLYGRRSERRTDGVGQLLLDLGEEATPEVVSALEEVIREAEQIVEDAEQEKQQRRTQRPRKDDRKFPPPCTHRTHR